MDSITFRAGEELPEILKRAELETGLNPSELCRVATSEYLRKTQPGKIRAAHMKLRVKAIQIRRSKEAVK